LNNNKKVLRNLIVYLGIPILLFVIMFMLFSGTEPEQPGLKYSDVIAYFEDGEVSSYKLDLGTGEMTFTVADETGKESKLRYNVPNTLPPPSLWAC